MANGNQWLLRNYYARARIRHRCDFCMSEVFPGQEYEGQVWVMNGHFFVLKRHSDPDCPTDDWWNHDLEENREQDIEPEEYAEAA